ncbi:hypothetical protein C8D72_1549 [Kushneria indalinina DSM 14324]|uniref:Uncharacterized protein n=1 Tax=Kushneria indalinina DSM 14324 TaxID=1122140 RepID=A0A3D9DVB3_9GAMM|nr:hypothetical protein C8D72_1549 [Kushneria indalinina DSM 14324]
MFGGAMMRCHGPYYVLSGVYKVGNEFQAINPVMPSPDATQWLFTMPER